MTMIIGISLALFVSMILLLIRALAGPSFFDRILALNSFGTVTVVLIAAIAFFMQEDSMLDVAIIYALINFVTTIAFLRFFQHQSLEKNE